MSLLFSFLSNGAGILSECEISEEEVHSEKNEEGRCGQGFCEGGYWEGGSILDINTQTNKYINEKEKIIPTWSIYHWYPSEVDSHLVASPQKKLTRY